MYERTSLHISQAAQIAGISNVCDYCAMEDDKTVPADFVSETRYFYADGLFKGPQYSHTSVCRSHLVALAENYRDMTS